MGVKAVTLLVFCLALAGCMRVDAARELKDTAGDVTAGDVKCWCESKHGGCKSDWTPTADGLQLHIGAIVDACLAVQLDLAKLVLILLAVVKVSLTVCVDVLVLLKAKVAVALFINIVIALILALKVDIDLCVNLLVALILKIKLDVDAVVKLLIALIAKLDLALAAQVCIKLGETVCKPFFEKMTGVDEQQCKDLLEVCGKVFVEALVKISVIIRDFCVRLNILVDLGIKLCLPLVGCIGV